MTAVKSKAASSPKPERKRDAVATRTALVEAATAIFKTDGYFATDTNAIARRAGYAPASFYKHFDDKAGILLAVYDKYARAEWQGLRDATATPKNPKAKLSAAFAFLGSFHKEWAQFRTDIRTAASREPSIATALSESRTWQLEALAELTGLHPKRGAARLLMIRLLAQHLSEALIEGEAAGVPKRQVLQAAETAILALIAEPRPHD